MKAACENKKKTKGIACRMLRESLKRCIRKKRFYDWYQFWQDKSNDNKKHLNKKAAGVSDHMHKQDEIIHNRKAGVVGSNFARGRQLKHQARKAGYDPGY